MHSILTFKMSDQSDGCINRDYNATLNMYEIVESLIKTGKRPECFCRKKEEVPEKPKKVLTRLGTKDTRATTTVKSKSLHIGK